MDDIKQIMEDLREGRIAPERLVNLVMDLQRQLQEARRRVADLEKQVPAAGTAKGSTQEETQEEATLQQTWPGRHRGESQASGADGEGFS